jgi:hypothetical protein
MQRFSVSVGLFFLIAGCVLVFGHSAQATSVTEVGFSDLVQRADVIAVGTVSEIKEQWDETRKAPLTLVTFSQLTVLKGNPGTSMTLEFLGGHTPQGLVLTIPGVPQFTVGEKTVVFEAGNRRDFCPLVGVWQGLLRVKTDPQSGIETVSDNFRVPITTIQAGKFLKLTPTSPEQVPLSLPALLQAIRQELQKS